VRVVEPGGYWNGVVRMEDVRGRRVVDDDGLRHLAAELGQILRIVQRVISMGMSFSLELRLAYLNIIASVIVATLSEQPVLDDLVYVQNIENRIGVLFRSGKSALH
jgi:hypothetical protein